MTTAFHELELESPELELAHEYELAGELGELGEVGELGESGELGQLGELSQLGEQELQHEQFFGQLATLARRAASSPALRRIGEQAARAAMQNLGGLLDESEFESESELEFEGEQELNGSSRDGLYSPVRKVYVDALMEHMAHEATQAENEQEAAEAFLPLIPMLAAKIAPLALKALPMVGKAAARIAPKVLQGVMKVAPQLTRGVGQVARTLFRGQGTRPLLRAIPTIARRTTAQLARRVARGGTVTPQTALRALAHQTQRTLSNPRGLVRAYNRGRRLDRTAHRLLPMPYGSMVTPPNRGRWARNGVKPPTYRTVPPSYGTVPPTYRRVPPTYRTVPPGYGVAPPAPPAYYGTAQPRNGIAGPAAYGAGGYPSFVPANLCAACGPAAAALPHLCPTCGR